VLADNKGHKPTTGILTARHADDHTTESHLRSGCGFTGFANGTEQQSRRGTPAWPASYAASKLPDFATTSLNELESSIEYVAHSPDFHAMTDDQGMYKHPHMLGCCLSSKV
jgi:hypothetical protein